MVKELRNVDKIIEKYNNYNNDKSALIQIFLDIQVRNHWLAKPILMWISKRLKIPIILINHIVTFCKAFSTVPRGCHLVQVCTGTACHVRGTSQLLERVTEIIKLKPGETDENLRFTLTTVNCLGCCALGPVMTVDGVYHSNPSRKKIKELVNKLKEKEREEELWRI
ncbi:NAD(P)H-dependent oxidoreductase subunit E [Candidatus Aerophobetes bacterium]|nr:NAD(P)H-dependent oxidoreductase subunit E [Candidatus Aerophobetes bacterium]